jgi:hypothetical protein
MLTLKLSGEPLGKRINQIFVLDSNQDAQLSISGQDGTKMIRLDAFFQRVIQENPAAFLDGMENSGK